MVMLAQSPAPSDAFRTRLFVLLKPPEVLCVLRALAAHPNPAKSGDAVPRDLNGVAWRVIAAERYLSRPKNGAKVENVAQSVAAIVRGFTKRRWQSPWMSELHAGNDMRGVRSLDNV